MKENGKLKLLTTSGEVIDAILYCHQETTTISGTSYYLLKLNTSADATGVTLSASTGSVARVVWGKFVFPLTNIAAILSGTIYATYRAYTGGGTVNAEVDILIREADGTVRTTIATGVSKSANLGTSMATYTGANYSFANYTIVDQTDYLEIDYIANVTVKKTAQYAYLRIDDNTLALADQTRSQEWAFSASVSATLSGNITLASSNSRLGSFGRTYSSISTLSSQLARGGSFFGREIFGSVNLLGDFASKIVIPLKELVLFVSMTLSSQISRNMVLSRIQNVGISLSETSSRFMSLFRSINVSSVLGSSFGRGLTSVRQLFVNISLSGAFSKIGNLTRSFVSNIGLSSVVYRIGIFERITSFSLNLASSFLGEIKGILTRSVIVGISLSSQVVRAFNGARVVNGLVPLSSQISRRMLAFRSEVENIFLSSAFMKIFTSLRGINASLVLSSSIGRLFNGFRGFVGGLNISSSLARISYNFRSFVGDLLLRSSFSLRLPELFQVTINTTLSLSSSFVGKVWKVKTWVWMKVKLIFRSLRISVKGLG